MPFKVTFAVNIKVNSWCLEKIGRKVTLSSLCVANATTKYHCSIKGEKTSGGITRHWHFNVLPKFTEGGITKTYKVQSIFVWVYSVLMFCSAYLYAVKKRTLKCVSSLQGSEIFTVVAKDGDVGNPNPIRYSFEEGEPLN